MGWGKRKATTSEQIDRELAAAALEKRRRGEAPSSREQTALRRVERQRDEEQRWEHYHTVPQKHYRKLAGKQTRQLRDQAATYGIPFDEDVVDLAVVIRGFHEFLSKNAYRLRGKGDADDPLLAGGNSPALEEYRKWRARLAELEYQERQQALLSRERVHDVLGQMAGVLRQAFDTLQRQFGAEAYELVDEALVDAMSLLDELVTPHDDG